MVEQAVAKGSISKTDGYVQYIPFIDSMVNVEPGQDTPRYPGYDLDAVKGYLPDGTGMQGILNAHP